MTDVTIGTSGILLNDKGKDNTTQSDFIVNNTYGNTVIVVSSNKRLSENS